MIIIIPNVNIRLEWTIRREILQRRRESQIVLVGGLWVSSSSSSSSSSSIISRRKHMRNDDTRRRRRRLWAWQMTWYNIRNSTKHLFNYGFSTILIRSKIIDNFRSMCSWYSKEMKWSKQFQGWIKNDNNWFYLILTKNK